MLKQVCLLTRRPDMTMAGFRDHYENVHARVAASLMPEALRYQRRYVQPEISPVTGQPIPVPFDCLTEIWWETREEFEAAMEAIGQGKAQRRLCEDEEMLFAAHDYPVFSAEDCETPMRGWEQGESLFKQIYLLKRRPGLSMEEFRERYENEHAVAGARRMPAARRYVRRYVRTEINPVAGREIEAPFDVMLEVWWGSREECEATVRAIAASGDIEEIREDREGIFASPDHPLFTVEEYETPMRGRP